MCLNLTVLLEYIHKIILYTKFNKHGECSIRVYNWGEPEQAPHKREVRAVGLSVCLSVRTFMTRKYTRTILIYGYLQLLIAAFKVVSQPRPLFFFYIGTGKKDIGTGPNVKEKKRSGLRDYYLMLLKHGAPVSLAWNL